MTTPAPAAVARLRELLPPHVLQRDAEAGGLLADLLDAVGRQLDLVEADVEQLYASWFVETCPEWVVPYIADLVGVTELPPDLRDSGADVSRRALVANTVGYRRRKGTVAVLEDVARAASGWPARAVECYRLLATTTHVNHVRLDRPATAGLRTGPDDGGPLDLVGTRLAQGALDPLAHTVDVRHIREHRGRHGIRNVGIYLFPDRVQQLAHGRARKPTHPADGWTVHPLGIDTPLYSTPTAESSVEHLAVESDLPVPLRPRRLLARLLAARRDGSPGVPDLRVRIGATDLLPERIRVCRLEDLAPVTGWQVMVDPVHGRLRPYLDGVPDDPGSIEFSVALGSTADVGAGTDDRSLSHRDLLDADPYVGDGTTDRSIVADQREVPGGTFVTPAAGLGAALSDLETAWAQPTAARSTYVVSLPDNGFHAGNLTVHVAAGTRLVVVGATWPPTRLSGGLTLPAQPGVYDPRGVQPTVLGSLTVVGAPGSSVVLDGLVVDGDVVVAAGDLGSLSLGRCTVAGSVRVVDGGPGASNAGIHVRAVRSWCGPVDLGSTVGDVEVVGGAVLGSATWHRDGGGTVGAAVVAPEADLVLDSSTVRGTVAVRTLSATSAILDGVATVADRQVGCVRYSYVTPSSRVPRRFRCVPAEGDATPERPSYVATDAGSPHFLALARTCAESIAEGGEDESEMGVHHRLHRPARRRAARRVLASYVPVGLEIGIAAPIAVGRS
ncbi:phage tail protein [Cellulomonas sp. ICMP 17802]|uniref:phage tail protein n=1 Tax=Cellulomonas sp. ICMP 17802 TaxID=3239199 RepID=UPI00351B2655